MADNFNTNDDEIQVITIEFEDDTTLDCGIVAIFTIEEQDYIALAEVDENNEFKDEMEIYLYRYLEDDNDENVFSLDNIVDDEEMNTVREVFEQIMQDELDMDDDDDENVVNITPTAGQAPFSASSDDAMVQDILNRIIRDKKY